MIEVPIGLFGVSGSCGRIHLEVLPGDIVLRVLSGSASTVRLGRHFSDFFGRAPGGGGGAAQKSESRGVTQKGPVRTLDGNSRISGYVWSDWTNTTVQPVHIDEALKAVIDQPVRSGTSALLGFLPQMWLGGLAGVKPACALRVSGWMGHYHVRVPRWNNLFARVERKTLSLTRSSRPIPPTKMSDSKTKWQHAYSTAEWRSGQRVGLITHRSQDQDLTLLSVFRHFCLQKTKEKQNTKLSKTPFQSCKPPLLLLNFCFYQVTLSHVAKASRRKARSARNGAVRTPDERVLFFKKMALC